MLVVLAALVSCQPSAAPTVTPLPPTPTEAPQLDQAILDAIAGHGGINGWAIIAQLDGAGKPIAVWRFEGGRFEEVDVQAFHEAMGDDRSRWPPDTFTFVIEDQSDDSAIVLVENYYDRGISPESRGGNASYLTLTLVEREWQSEWETVMFWD
jgi:hypothetical protein